MAVFTLIKCQNVLTIWNVITVCLVLTKGIMQMQFFFRVHQKLLIVTSTLKETSGRLFFLFSTIFKIYMYFLKR